MTPADPTTLGALAAAAAVTGVLHTLAGPDHYVPLVAAARARGWSGTKAMATTALCGVLHCATSALLVPLALAAAVSLGALENAQALRGDLTAYLLLGLGCALLFTAWRSSRAQASAPGTTAAAPPRASWLGLKGLLLVAFALGPCEWLLPNALAAHAAGGTAGALAIAAVFTLATTATMLATVALSLRLLPRRLGAGGRAFAGAACALSGALLLVGL